MVDLDLNVKYPSVAHRAVKLAVPGYLSRRTADLYVYDQGQEKLILVGSAADLTKQCRNWSSALRQREWPLPPGLLLSAQTYLDWLGPALVRHKDCGALRPDNILPLDPQFSVDPSAWQVFLHRANEFNIIQEEAVSARKPDVQLLESQEPLPENLMVAIKKALSWQYPYQDAASLAAKASVSELKGRPAMGLDRDPEANEGLRYFIQPMAERPRFITGQTELTAVEYGSAVHLILEHLDLKRELTATDIKEQIEELVRQEFITEEQAATADVTVLAAFFAGPLGRRLTARPESVRREVPFSLVLPAAEAYPKQQLSPATASEPILVQGIIDAW